MKRDFEQFPDDENGDVLWRMKQHGDNLTVRREINFSVIFPTEEAALAFAVHLLKNEQKISFSAYPGDAKLPWQVQVHPMMLPVHKTITEYEALLGEDAAKHGGRNDGWGSFNQS